MLEGQQSEFIANVLMGDYLKLARVNLMTGEFEFLKMDMMMQEDGFDTIHNIYDFIRHQVETGMVLSAYAEEYLRYSDADYVQKRVFSGERRIIQTYKRKTADGGLWVTFGIVSALDCSPESPYAVFSWREADTDVRMLHEERQELVAICYRDALTRLYNRHQFNADLEQFQSEKNARFTCLYIDVNGLHEMNNHLGHKRGDDMLCCVGDAMLRYFPAERSYRIGGDEFVMLSSTLSKSSVEELVRDMRRELDQDHYTISVGIESGEEEYTVYRVLGAAELAMRADKEMYYKQGGADRRKRTMDEELERTMMAKHDAEYFLKLISKSYAGVYFVDLLHDTMRHIYMPKYFRELFELTDFRYSKALQLYAEKYIDPECYDGFIALTNYDDLAARLRKEELVLFDYRKTDGSIVHLHILETDVTSDDRHETIWVFSR